MNPIDESKFNADTALLKSKFGEPYGYNDFCVTTFKVKDGWIVVDNEDGTWSLCEYAPKSNMVTLRFTGSATQAIDAASLLGA